MKKGKIIILSVIVLIILAGLTYLFIFKDEEKISQDNGQDSKINQVEIITENVNLYSDLSINSNVIGNLKKGEFYNILSEETNEEGNWYYISLNDNTKGFVIDNMGDKDFLKVIYISENNSTNEENKDVEEESNLKENETETDNSSSNSSNSNNVTNNSSNTNSSSSNSSSNESNNSSTDNSQEVEKPITNADKTYQLLGITGVGEKWTERNKECIIMSIDNVQIKGYVNNYISVNADVTIGMLNYVEEGESATCYIDFYMTDSSGTLSTEVIGKDSAEFFTDDEIKTIRVENFITSNMAASSETKFYFHVTS